MYRPVVPCRMPVIFEAFSVSALLLNFLFSSVSLTLSRGHGEDRRRQSLAGPLMKARLSAH